MLTSRLRAILEALSARVQVSMQEDELFYLMGKKVVTFVSNDEYRRLSAGAYSHDTAASEVREGERNLESLDASYARSASPDEKEYLKARADAMQKLREAQQQMLMLMHQATSIHRFVQLKSLGGYVAISEHGREVLDALPALASIQTGSEPAEADGVLYSLEAGVTRVGKIAKAIQTALQKWDTSYVATNFSDTQLLAAASDIAPFGGDYISFLKTAQQLAEILAKARHVSLYAAGPEPDKCQRASVVATEMMDILGSKVQWGNRKSSLTAASMSSELNRYSGFDTINAVIAIHADMLGAKPISSRDTDKPRNPSYQDSSLGFQRLLLMLPVSPEVLALRMQTIVDHLKKRVPDAPIVEICDSAAILCAVKERSPDDLMASFDAADAWLKNALSSHVVAAALAAALPGPVETTKLWTRHLISKLEATNKTAGNVEPLHLSLKALWSSVFGPKRDIPMLFGMAAYWMYLYEETIREFRAHPLHVHYVPWFG